MAKVILAIDSQILNAYQSCPRLADFQFNQHIRPNDKAVPLERGSLYHDVMEVFYSLVGDCVSARSEMFPSLKAAGLVFTGNRDDRRAMAQFAIECGRYRAIQTELDADLVETSLRNCAEYFDYYRHDTWQPLAVERVGSRVLYEDDNVKFIYTFKIDVIMQQGTRIMPVDHKTASRNEEPSDMENQFMGYCSGMRSNSIMINRIGLQKSLPASKKFLRHIFTYTPNRILEWEQNTIDTMFDIVNSHENERWPQNLTSCNKWSGCIFKIVCAADPVTRTDKLERFYHIGPKWDPGVVSASEEVVE